MSIHDILSLVPIDVLTVIGGGLVALFKSIKFIQEGEKGVKLRFGKAVRNGGVVRIYEPGFTLLVPFVDTLVRHPVRQQTIPFNSQRIILKDGLTFEISAFVLFRITDVYKALFEIDHLEGSLEDVGTGALRDKIMTLTHEELSETAEIAQSILVTLKRLTESWGVEIIDFRLTNCAPSSEAVNLLNIPAKFAMLKTAAIELGQPLEKIDAGLLSVLIGAPLVANAPVHQLVTTHGQASQNQRSRMS